MKKTIVSLLLLAVIPWSGLVSAADGSGIDPAARALVKEFLYKKYGNEQQFRINRGVDQAANLWRASDGSVEDFSNFCKKYFIADKADLEKYFKKIEFYSEIINGYATEMNLDLRQPLDLDWGEISPIDMTMGRFNIFSHLSEDMFKNKINFIQLLNFPRYSLAEVTKLGPGWSREQWAYDRTSGPFSRIPSEINQHISAVMTDADTYISQYNVFMGNLIDNNGKRYFPKNLKLITHWGLRDELKARYASKQGLINQKIIYRVMERIISQEIPQQVINSREFFWNPFSNKVFAGKKKISSSPEPDTRYKHLLSVFQAMRKVDPYMPHLPTFILRQFEANREILEKDVEQMFIELLSSPQVKMVAGLIKKRLKRNLLPFDIWYSGFRSNKNINEEELDKIVAAKYPDRLSFEKDIKNILLKLGFPESSAAFIAPRIRVDASRGAGHAAGAGMKKFKARLRTRVPEEGMNYKGYNIAVHELGHTVEQTLTLNKIDYFALNGVPNNAFTEAFAFVFQDRDLELLGIEQKDPNQHHLKVLDNFWNAYEIMGVSLVDMKVWNWLYNNPDASAHMLKLAVIKIAKEIWNRYYAPVFKIKDQTILAIYSHMISYPLYLPDYPLGHVIQFQIEEFLKGKVLGVEMERMCRSGNIIPQLWMKHAVGNEISVKPLLKAVNIAVGKIK